MTVYTLLYSRTSRDQIKSLHPQIKPCIKSHIEQLKENPYLGKGLERELSGYYSLRMKRFRVIYNIDHQHHVVYIHYVGHRKNIYELFRDVLERVS
ncbi:MAG: type II toxin-antitoxin system RelE/ParE family toxin [Deltaproteobacteria bacterium]|nr:type II toxin-antitoxin system RelE/ParE family toxin [Deltaproteobacteria bacterium]